jgi:hypothetical protein
MDQKEKTILYEARFKPRTPHLYFLIQNEGITKILAQKNLIMMIVY